MKRALILYEGAADERLTDFRGRSPLQVARSPEAADLVSAGAAGLLQMPPIPKSQWFPSLLFPLLGLRTSQFPTLSRASCEWALHSSELEADARVYHGSFVTLGERGIRETQVDLSVDETQSLADAINQYAENTELFDAQVVVLQAGQVLVRFGGAGENVKSWPPGTPPPQLGAGKPGEFRKKADSRLARFWDMTQRVLSNHPVNEVRIDLHENPASGLCLWDGGTIQPQRDRSGKGSTCMLTNRPFAEGLARLLRLPSIRLPSPYALDDTHAAFDPMELGGKLEGIDNLIVYISAPRTFGSFGSPADKVRALDKIDYYVLRPLRSLLKAQDFQRIVLAADGAVASASGRAVNVPLPVAIKGGEMEPDAVDHFDEVACESGALGTMNLEQFLEHCWSE